MLAALRLVTRKHRGSYTLPHHSATTITAATLVISLLASPSVFATSPQRGQMSTDAVYQVPGPELTALVDAPTTPAVAVSPDHEHLLLMEVPGLNSIADLAQPELRIAGLRISPRTNGPSRARYFVGMTIKRLADGAESIINGLPESPRIGNVAWSPDGARLAFTITRDQGIELWTADVATATAQRLTGARVNAAYGRAFSWKNDSRTLVTRLVPSERGAMPQASMVPTGPVIQQTTGKNAAARTYQDLLKNADDEALFEHFMTSQAALVTVDGHVTEIGPEALIASTVPSPDGLFLLVTRIERPFSYIVPVSRFPRRIDVWDNDGVGVKSIAALPLQEELPLGFDSVATGHRSVGWRTGTDATLYWVEAQDGGDGRAPAEVRDRMFTLAAPFEGEPTAVADLGLRFAGVRWSGGESGSDGNLALVSTRWRRSRQTRTWVVRPDSPGSAPTLLWDRSQEDRYGDPGRPINQSGALGSVLKVADDGSLFLLGQGASPAGNRPFIDRLDLNTQETTRLWRSEAPYYESTVALLDETGNRVLTRRESVEEPPNYFVRDLTSGNLQQITEFTHPTPQLANVSKELIRYERADGVKLTGVLYLPSGHEEGDGPLPVLMWAYPREYKDASLAGQLTDSPYRFVRVSTGGALPMLTQGWAVFDNPSLPIIGEGDEEPNDSYVDQLVAGARAAIDVLVERGIADPERVAIGGHSYGAFMTANLLAHSDLFRAGIARSGAYNRTLTPFGFQSEERTFWQAPEIYFAMSPFMHADKVNEPILMIHGEADDNSGTFPLQSRRFYSALKGHGALARLVMLPHESHGYRARESILHMLWEQSEFLKRSVEFAPGRNEMTGDGQER